MNKNCRLVPETYLNFLVKRDGSSLAQHLLDTTERAPLEFCPNVFLDDLMPKESRGVDYTLPQGLVNSIMEKMDFDIRGHFVSDCRQGFELLPVTTVGRAVLPIIKKIIYKEV